MAAKKNTTALVVADNFQIANRYEGIRKAPIEDTPIRAVHG